MNILLCGATGFIGRNLVPALLNDHHSITVVGRNSDKIKKTFPHSIECLSWDNLNQISPDNFDAVINLAGENIADARWNSYTKQKIIASRVECTNHIIQWCLTAKNHKPHIYNASAIGIYGLQPTTPHLPPALSESDPIAFGQPSDFLSTVGQAWESATKAAVAADFPVTIMRFAVVLKRHEGILKKLELPFSLGLGTILGTGNQAFTWIHIDDLINAILFLLKHPDITGTINLCAPECISQRGFAKTLAHTLHRPLLLTLPATAITLLFGQMGQELLLGGQHIAPERLQQLGYSFMYPDIHSALQHEWPLMG